MSGTHALSFRALLCLPLLLVCVGTCGSYEVYERYREVPGSMKQGGRQFGEAGMGIDTGMTSSEQNVWVSIQGFPCIDTGRLKTVVNGVTRVL